jgi:alkanesulfonate monooxygenase SsuD/methylene tetrahydromethanopterin reductase-like flavin-dependent oxidoreductase (luciferase family)
MQYGISLPNFGYFGDVQVMADLARDAEQAGWNGFFIWDHIAVGDWAGNIPVVDPWIAMTAVAMQTGRIRFGALVTPLPRRRPWKVARETASLDRLSDGRLVMGVGIGIGPDEWDHLGEETDLVVRGAMLDEALDILTGLWGGEPFSYAGDHYTIQTTPFLPVPVQQPRIPIWVGSMWPSKASLRRAARWDGLFPWLPEAHTMQADEERDQLAQAIRYARDHRTTDAPFDVIHMGRPTPGDDPAQAAAITAPFEATGVTWWLEIIAPLREGPERADYWTFDRLRERVLQGPPRG